MARTPGLLTDGMLTAEAGVDSGFAPSLLPPNQLAWAINTTVRGGFPQARPGWWMRELRFLPGVNADNLRVGLFQGAGTYIADDGRAYLAVQVSGRQWLIDIQSNLLAREITVPADPSDPARPHAWFQQAENFLVVQNGIDLPFLYDGSGSRRANTGGLGGQPKEVPIGGPMAYGKGRLWVASGSEYYGGDLVWSDPIAGRGSVIRFTENDFLNEGGAFTVPEGPITGMAFGANLDTSLGDGDLLVFAPSATFAFSAPVDRDVWKDLQYPIQRFALVNFGSLNHEGIVAVNGDLFFRAADGIRSLVYARRDFSTEWGNTPMSRQVQRVLQFDTAPLLSEASAVVFANRMLMTTLPQQSPQGTWHKGLVSLDFDLVSGMGRKLPPAWEGVWTGARILRLVTIRDRLKERCFAWVLGDDNRIGLMEITADGLFDFDGLGDVPVQWIVETRSMTFNQPMDLKRLESLETWYDRVAGQVSVNVRFRPNENECWTTWGTVDDCAQYKDCGPYYPCKDFRVLKPASRSRRSFPRPPAVVDPQTGRHTNEGFEFQVRMENTGRFRMKRIMVGAMAVQQPGTGDISGFACPAPQQDACQTGCIEIECAGYCSSPPDYEYLI